MAYVSKETAKSVREALKKEFPTSKFSVRGSGGHALGVTIRKSDLFEPGTTVRINHHWFNESDSFTEDQKQFLSDVIQTVRKAGGHFDDSDSMTDYFNCAFYENYMIDIKE